MKKIILSITLLLFILTSFSQTCTVNTTLLNNYISPSTWGMMPDTTDNLPPAYVNVQYDTVLSFKLPMYADDLDPAQPHIQLTNIELLNITGLPNGIVFTSASSTTDSIFCSTSNCKWNAGAIGCLRIIGTPTVSGVFPLIITLKATTIVGATGNGDIKGYKLVITPLGIAKIQKPLLNVSQNSPNPFVKYTDISFSVLKKSNVKFYVMNILGEIVHEETIRAKQGKNKIKFESNNLNKGIYFYSLEIGGNKITKRMIIKD